MNNFDVSLSKVLVHEGGYINHPKDPGGATNRGVTQRVYDIYRDRKGVPHQTVKNITSAEVSDIYKTNYWNLAKCERLPDGIDYVVFDGAVNSGVSQSIKWLQRAVGVTADGVIGPATLNAVDNFGNDDELVDRICNRRLEFLKALKTWSTFGKGWSSRVFDVRATGKAMAINSPSLPMMTFSENGQVKGLVADAKAPPSTAPGDAASGAGGLTVLLTQAQEQLTPYVNIGFVAKAAAILTIVGVVVGVGGFAYRTYAKWRKRKLDDALDVKSDVVPAS